MAFEATFQPIKIGEVEIKNRVVAGPMNTLFAQSTGGYVNEQVLAYYAARAKGGCGLVITEAAMGTRQAAAFPAWANLLCYNQSHIPGLNELVETCHDFGAKVFIQLSPGFGRQGNSPTGEPSPPLSFAALLKLVREKRVQPSTILRGPLTLGVWRQARFTPKLCRLFGACHYCGAKLAPNAAVCGACKTDPDRPHKE